MRPTSSISDALPDAAGLAGRRQAAVPARHRRGRPRHALAPDLRRALLAAHRRSSSSRFALIGGIILGLLAGYFRGWVDVADHARHGHHPGLPVAAAGAGAGRHPRPRPVQRHAGHRAGAAAAFRPADARRRDGREEPRIRDLGQGRRRRPYQADARHHPAQLPRAADRPGDAVASPTPSSRPPRSASSASARSRRRPNGAPCSPRRASSSCAPGGS